MKIPAIRNINIHAAHVFIHQLRLPFRIALVVGIAMNSDSGLSKSICKLRLTVGCCEKTIANSISPHKPVDSIKARSSHQ